MSLKVPTRASVSVLSYEISLAQAERAIGSDHTTVRFAQNETVKRSGCHIAQTRCISQSVSNELIC